MSAICLTSNALFRYAVILVLNAAGSKWANLGITGDIKCNASTKRALISAGSAL